MKKVEDKNGEVTMHAETEFDVSTEQGDAKFRMGNHAFSVDFERELYSGNDWKVASEANFTYEFEEGTSNSVELKVSTPTCYGVSAHMNVSVSPSAH